MILIASIVLGLLAAVPSNATMQWTMQSHAGGSIAFQTIYRVTTPSGESDISEGREYNVSEIAATFRGFSAAQLRNAGTALQFQIVHQEGTLACTGHTGAAGIASGTFAPQLDPAFASQLQKRGVSGLTDKMQMEWLIEGADVYGLLDGLSSYGIGVSDATALNNAINHGVNARYVAELRSSGMHASSLEQLVRARDHGVGGRFLEAAKSYGLNGLSLDSAVTLVDHGVSPRYLSGLSQLGYHVSADQAIKMVDHGVTIHYIERLRASGYTNLSVNDLIRLADHGVR